MSTTTTYATAVALLVPGANLLGATSIAQAVQMAVAVHSQKMPQEITEEVAGDGGFDYDLSILTYWTDNFSDIKSIEYPVDDTSREDSILDPNTYKIKKMSSGTYLRFLEDTPGATEEIRITYTALHTLSATASTIPTQHDYFVQLLAAALYCEMNATYFAQCAESTLNADSADHMAKAREYQARADAYRKQYNDYFFPDIKNIGAAFAFKDLDFADSQGNEYLLHPSSLR